MLNLITALKITDPTLTYALIVSIINHINYHTIIGDFMSTEKIAITVPPAFLIKLDSWAKKTGKSRSRFIVEEMDKRLIELEDEEITRLYNKAYGDSKAGTGNSELAEEMFAASAVHEEEDKW